MTDAKRAQHRIAAFDFDGTSIQGNSPVLLVRYLHKRDMLKKRVLAKIISWAAAYKLRLPQNEAWVRGLVFTAFEGWEKEQADAFLRAFHDEIIEGQKRFRPAAHERMEQLRAQGVEVLVVSATFGPIVRRSQEFHPFDTCLCTEMATDEQGRYTRLVSGVCVEGQEKVKAIRAYADARYGEGNWELVEAYGDHHSDIPLLGLATRGFAVTPDNPLERAAKRNGWTILDWGIAPDKDARSRACEPARVS